MIAGTCSSDRRLKEDIVYLNNTLDKVTSLKPVKFKWKYNPHNNGNLYDYGLIAQEVQKVLPELVEEDSDGYLRVKYDVSLTMHLLEALRELKEENVKLKKDIEILKYELCSLNDSFASCN